MKEKVVRRTNRNENKVLTDICSMLHIKRGKISIKFRGGNCIATKLRGVDAEELSMFLLGLFKEAYDVTNKNKVFTSAVKSILTEYLEDIDRDSESA